MAVEMVTSSQSSQTSNPPGSISILVVDDDTTCLAIVAAILKSWKYEVVTVKHAVEALCALRVKGGSFDLVVTDVHMPDMNGFELQKKIEEEFKLPVVFMSADDKESVILQGLQSGAAFFIVKPISPNDLKNLWQYAVSRNKKNKTIIQGTSENDKGSDGDLESASTKKDRQSAKDSKRKASAKNVDVDKGENKQDDSATLKKAKIVWTNALHNQFLEAIRSIGLDRAVPKKILELMNVPGLTRENVASHLQKYRIFLKRVSEASYKIQSTAERNMAERSFHEPRLHYLDTGLMKAPSHGNPSSYNQEASSSNSAPRFGSGQSCLLCSQGSFKQPIIGSAKSLYHPTGLLPNGSASGGLMSGTNLIQMCQQKNQVPPKSSTDGFPKYDSRPYIVTGLKDNGNIGASNNSNLNLKPNYSNTNYVGYCLAGDGKLVGSGNYLGYMGVQALPDVNHNNGLMNGMKIGNSGDHLAQGVSSGGFKSSTHISPSLSNSIQQENNSVTPVVPPALVQQTSFRREGVNDNFCGQWNKVNVSNFDSNSFLQPYGETDLSFSFPDLIDIHSPTQQDGEETLSSYDTPLVNKQSVEQQSGGEVMAPNFGIARTLSDEYFPSFDLNPGQQEDEEFLKLMFGPSEYGWDDNPGGL